MLRKLLMACALCLAAAAVPSRTGATPGPHGSHGPHGGVESPALQLEIAALREATARFHRLEVALQEGYEPFGGCFSDPSGGMGFHYSNPELIADPAVDPLHPELLLYEKAEGGAMRLVGVEYIAFQAAWHALGHRQAPKLFGQRFHLNTTLLPEPFYLLHVWPWKHNPSGRFADWNPRVTCPNLEN